ncbi:MAG: single-stranded-DNA-specific exonuclease RecJ, partial [Bacteroidota bacterium]
ASLAKSINVDATVARILMQRGVTGFDEAKDFFRPSLDMLHDPFLMTDMEKAVTRMRTAIESKERILVYGDYDVDGTTSVSLVFSYLRLLGADCSFYIPDRNSEGYGVSAAGIDHAIATGVKLVIALDLGIKAAAMVDKAAAAGIDFIICDHHLPDATMPKAVAVLDPKRPDCTYPFNELSGCGIGFKLIQAYARRHGNETDVFPFLDLVAVSIASDIVPVIGENRTLAYFGLQLLNREPRPGLRALIDISGLKKSLDIDSIVFSVGPRINAAGRIAHAHGAVDLLISESTERALEMAGQLNLRNAERREFDATISEEAEAMIRADEQEMKAYTTVVCKETWHKGVVGIVASRLLDKFYRPTIVLTHSNGKITGSARSVEGFDLHGALEQCSDLLEKFGGHKYAAGLTMDPEKLPAFRQRFEEVVRGVISEEQRIPVTRIDAVIGLQQITEKFFDVIRQMAPFGPFNLKPVFETRSVSLREQPMLLKDRHLKFTAITEGMDRGIGAICFDRPDLYEVVRTGQPFNMAYHIEENEFNGVTSLQIRIKDIQPA